MSDLDRIKDKLAKLLRLGEDLAASDGEIQNALNLAAQMMAKHQLTRADIDASAADPLAKMSYGRHVGFCKGAKSSTWECALAWFICDYLGTVQHYLSNRIPLRKNGIALSLFASVNTGGNVPTGCGFYFYGPDEDSRSAAAMFEEFRDAISTMAIIRYGGWARGDGFAYAYGFASGLQEANRKARLGLKQDSDSATTALILKSEQTSLAIRNKSKDWLATAHNVKLGKGSSRSVSLSSSKASAYAEGKSDGRNYQVSKPQRHKRIG